MSKKVDLKDLKRNSNIVEVIGRYLTLKKAGSEWLCSCPFHEESTSSFKVNEVKKRYKCFGCGKGGDVFDFLINWGLTWPEAIKAVEDPYNTAGVVPFTTTSSAPKPVEWKVIEPRSPFKSPDPTHHVMGKPSKVWYYRNGQGHPLCLICRFDLKPGEKEVIPLTYCVNEFGTESWRWQGLPKPRPVYNLHFITLRTSEPIMIVEGEKAAEAAHALFPKYTASTWIGGADGIRATDFTSFAGRNIVLWPDNDKGKLWKDGPRKGQPMLFHELPGNKAMFAIAAILKDICPSIKWVRNAEDFPSGWDVADASWTVEEANKYLEENLIDIPDIIEYVESTPIVIAPPVVDRRDDVETKVIRLENTRDLGNEFENKFGETAIPPQEKLAAKKDGFTEIPIKIDPEDIQKNDVEDLKANNIPPDDPEDPNSKKPKGFKGGGYFRMLGYQKDVNVNLYHFYSYKAKTVISLSPSAMTKPNLLQLAPLDWWQGFFPRSNKRGEPADGFELDKAQNWLIDESVKSRIFNSKLIRGRGAWIDGEKVVIHSGEKLVVNGQSVDFHDHNSRYIYEIGEDMGFKMADPLSTKQSGVLLDILKLVNWEREIDAYLLAGWCVVAPMCGALTWRPHIWVTGSAGSGKSWIFEKLVRRLLGESAMAVQGETSEAGLRQMLKHDALPVVFDEAEGEDKKAQDRMADVLALMRSSSASDGGIMAKGTSGGRANTYKIRSCFAFASIAIQITHQSDRTRITILSLKKPEKSELRDKRWKDLVKKYQDTVTEDYATRLRARTISMLPVILKNAETFSAAAAAELGQQRAGDQIGVLLAGAFSLRSAKVISYKEALAWIQERDWSEEKNQEATRDELSLIQHILSQVTRIESSHGPQERTIGELVQLAAGNSVDKALDMDQANERLMRLGMKVAGYYLVIGNSVDAINKYLAGTHWAKNYNKILQRLDGAVDCEPTRFASGLKIRGTKIPMENLFKRDQGALFEVLSNKIPTTSAPIISADPKNPDEKPPF